jgi:hypothetical protein
MRRIRGHDFSFFPTAGADERRGSAGLGEL